MGRRVPVHDDQSLEQALRSAVLRGDERAWAALYERAFDGVYAYVAARLRRDPERVAETLQDAWLVAGRRIADFEPARAPFGAWMCGVADFVLRNRVRKDARRSRREISVTDAGADPAARPAPLPENRDRIERAAAAVAGLPPAYGAVLIAKYRDGLSVAEIAAREGRSPKAAESLLGRAREAFRRLFLAEEPTS